MPNKIKEEIKYCNECNNKSKAEINKYKTAVIEKLFNETRCIELVDLYPYNLIMDIIEENNNNNIGLYSFSPKLIKLEMEKVLSDRENRILEMRYRWKFTYEECGKALGISKVRARQIEIRAMQKMKKASVINNIQCVPRIDFIKLQDENKELKDQIEQLKFEINHYKEKFSASELQCENIRSQSIDELNLSVRSYNCMKKTRLNTIGAVVDMINNDSNSFLKIRNLGQRSTTEIINKIREKGLSVKDII